MDPQQSHPRPLQPVENLAEILVQATSRLIDLQTSAIQALLRMQSRNAALLGAPDWSRLFDDQNAQQVSELFSAGAEQALNVMRETHRTLYELQGRVNDVFAHQARQLTDQLRAALSETQENREAVLQVREITQKSREEVRETAESAKSVLQGSPAEERARAKR